MGTIETIASYIPTVSGPTQKHLGFNIKMRWTLTILFVFFILGSIPLWGLDPASQFQFAQLELILGASFGSLMSLGIGPIVTASIVLQLLKGSGILNIDTHTEAGKKKFQALQRVSSLFFVVFEAFIYVYMGGLTPPAGSINFTALQLGLVFQLAVGGFLIMLMDEVISKWGFGSGIGLFIAAGVSKEVVVRTLSPFRNVVEGVASEGYVGAVPELFRTIFIGDTTAATLSFAAIVSTIIVFFMVVYTQAMRVEIPLSFGRVRGHGVRWPLNFFYTSNIPVILVAALLANVQLWARLMQNWAESSGSALVARISAMVGTYAGDTPVSGFILYVTPPNLLQAAITNSFTTQIVVVALVYTVILAIGSTVFSYFWVQTAGLDAKSQAKNIMASGLQVPGFRKDPRVVERLLERYVLPLTLMGGLAVGVLAALADLAGALTSGMGLLLAVMIIYKTYEEVAKEQAYDMNPMMRKFLGK
ncbi:MAG: preprotein translocase subunit SecY [Candidatus Woesearchaeota archaeon]